MIDYDFIEIGTSDFDTLVEACLDSSVGLSIEPVEEYFNRLPTKPNTKKIKCAVSDYDTETTLWWVASEDITKFNLPNWVRGCGTIGYQHPLLIDLLSHLQLFHIYKSDKCKIVSWKTLVNEEKIKSVKFLKIDAEGSDYSILESILESDVIPDKIQFENKDFINRERYNSIIMKYNYIGYKNYNFDNYNVILEKI